MDLSEIFGTSGKTYSFSIPYKRKDRDKPILTPAGAQFANSEKLIEYIEHMASTLSLNVLNIEETDDELILHFNRRSDHFIIHSLLLGKMDANLLISLSPIDPTIDIDHYAVTIKKFCESSGIRYVLDTDHLNHNVTILLETNKDLAIVLAEDDALRFDTLALESMTRSSTNIHGTEDRFSPPSQTP